MGRVITAGDEYWPVVAGILQKARNSWGRMLQILIREGADPKMSGHQFKAVVQVVLLFGAEMWVLTPRMDRALRSFHHRVAHRLTRKKKRRRRDYILYYPPLYQKWQKQALRILGRMS